MPVKIWKRKDGRYEYKYYENYTRKSLYAKTKSDLLEKIKKIKKDEKDTKEKIKKAYTFNDLLYDYLEIYKKPKVKEKVFKNMKYYLEHFKNALGNKPIKKITTENIQSELNNYEVSRKKEFLTLYIKAIFQYAVDTNKITFNPAKIIKKEERQAKVVSALSYDEQVKLLKYFDTNTKFKPYFLLYTLTGIRKNEIYDILEKNHKQGYIKVKREKSHGKIKKIMVKPIVFEIIKEIEKTQYKPDYIYNQFKKIYKELKIDASIHTLRHTYITNQYHLGTPAKYIQEWAGHEDISLTLNVYTNTDLELTKERIINIYNNNYYYVG